MSSHAQSLPYESSKQKSIYLHGPLVLDTEEEKREDLSSYQIGAAPFLIHGRLHDMRGGQKSSYAKFWPYLSRKKKGENMCLVSGSESSLDAQRRYIGLVAELPPSQFH